MMTWLLSNDTITGWLIVLIVNAVVKYLPVGGSADGFQLALRLVIRLLQGLDTAMSKSDRTPKEKYEAGADLTPKEAEAIPCGIPPENEPPMVLDSRGFAPRSD